MSDVPVTVPAAAPVEEEAELRRLSPLTPVARSGIFLLAAGYAVGRDVLQQGKLAGVAIMFGALIVAGLVFGFASWYRTSFRITADELRIDAGVISRRSRRVRIDRILEIGVDQPLIARLLGLAELKIETATTDSEVSLAYLPAAEAERVRTLLLDRRAVVAARAEGTTGDTVDPAVAESPATAPIPLVQVPVRWQVLGLLLSVESVGLVLIGIVVVVLVIAGVPFGAFGVGAATVLGAAVSLARKSVDWWGWTVSAVPTGLQVRHGMFSVSTRTFNVARLQGVRISRPVLQRPFGLSRLDLSVAGGGAKDAGEGDSRGVALPVAPDALVRRLATDLIGTDPDRVVLTSPPARARWFRPFTRRFLGLGTDGRVVVARKGWVTRRTDLVPWARVQSFRLRQGPFQRRLGLATVHADTPQGLVEVVAVHRDAAEARRFVVDGAERARLAGRVRREPPAHWLTSLS